MQRGFNGKRSCNPLTPEYFYPGGTENVNTMNDPYGEKTCSMSKANFKTASNKGIQALKDKSVAGAASSKAASSLKSDIAVSEHAKKSNRPQTAKPFAGGSSKRSE